VQLYPDQRTALDAAYAGSLGLIPDGRRKADGIAVGEASGAADPDAAGFRWGGGAITAQYSGQRPRHLDSDAASLPGALDPGRGSVRPFLMEDGSQFRRSASRAEQPAIHARLDEIEEIGSSTGATARRSRPISRGSGSPRAAGLGPAAGQAAMARGLTLSECARSLFSVWPAPTRSSRMDAKFACNQWAR
jgi:hypothetical protein